MKDTSTKFKAWIVIKGVFVSFNFEGKGREGKGLEE